LKLSSGTRNLSTNYKRLRHSEVESSGRIRLDPMELISRVVPIWLQAYRPRREFSCRHGLSRSFPSESSCSSHEDYAIGAGTTLRNWRQGVWERQRRRLRQTECRGIDSLIVERY